MALLATSSNTATGTVKKTTTTGTSSIQVPFNNQGGTVDAESGTLRSTNGGVNTGGTYNANGSGTIDLTGGANPTFTGTYTGSGTGRVQLASGTLTIGSVSATFSFPNALFVISGGTLAGPGTLTNANTGFITISGGTLGGTLNNQGTITQISGTLTINGTLSNSSLDNIALVASGTATNGGGLFANTSAGTLELSTNVTATLLSAFANQGVRCKRRRRSRPGHWCLAAATAPAASTTPRPLAALIDLAGTNTANLTGNYSGTGNGTVGLTLGGLLAVSAQNNNGSSRDHRFYGGAVPSFQR